MQHTTAASLSVMKTTGLGFTTEFFFPLPPSAHTTPQGVESTLTQMEPEEACNEKRDDNEMIDAEGGEGEGEPEVIMCGAYPPGFQEVVATRRLSRPANLFSEKDLVDTDQLKQFIYMAGIVTKFTLNHFGLRSTRYCPQAASYLRFFRVAFICCNLAGIVLTALLFLWSVDTGTACCAQNGIQLCSYSNETTSGVCSAAGNTLEGFCGERALVGLFEGYADVSTPDGVVARMVLHAMVVLVGGYVLFAPRTAKRPPGWFVVVVFVSAAVATTLLIGAKTAAFETSCSFWKELAESTKIPGLYSDCISFVELCGTGFTWQHTHTGAGSFTAAAAAAAALSWVDTGLFLIPLLCTFPCAKELALV